MYTTHDNEFILFPCSGNSLNEEKIFLPKTGLDELTSSKFDKLLTNCSHFSEMSRFTNIIYDDENAKNYLKEYFSELKKCNSDKEIYKDRKSLTIPLVKSIHFQITKSLMVQKNVSRSN